MVWDHEQCCQHQWCREFYKALFSLSINMDLFHINSYLQTQDLLFYSWQVYLLENIIETVHNMLHQMITFQYEEQWPDSWVIISQEIGSNNSESGDFPEIFQTDNLYLDAEDRIHYKSSLHWSNIRKLSEEGQLDIPSFIRCKIKLFLEGSITTSPR